MPTEKSTFERLFAVNVNNHTEKKNGLTYLSWPFAWAEVKKVDPKANYTIYENQHGWNYHTDGRTCWVKTGVTVDGVEHIEELPVMDMRNRSIPYDQVTSFDVNKAIQRSLTKACSRHGLGLYIYAGEDLPEEEVAARVEAAKFPEAPKKAVKEEKKLLTWKQLQNGEYADLVKWLKNQKDFQGACRKMHEKYDWEPNVEEAIVSAAQL